MTATTAATPFHEALALVKKNRSARVERFKSIRPVWDKFYSLADIIGRDGAAQVLPDEARVIDEFEASAIDTNAESSALLAALLVSLEGRASELAEASVGRTDISIIARLRDDLTALEEFRSGSLDGIGGSFWRVVSDGHGASPKEADRMINRILSAWCGVYEIKPAVVVGAVSIIGMLPDAFYEGNAPASEVQRILSRAQDYPFNLADDLLEVRTWGEKNLRVIDALLEEHARHGDWSAVTQVCGRQ